MTGLAVDTSVAVPLIVENHAHHEEVSAWWRGRTGSLCGPALIETYSVATRLPAPMKLEADDAVRLMQERFAHPLALSVETVLRVPALLADQHIAGGAVYDAVVALTAIEHGRILATRDRRARGTYERMGVDVLVVGA